MSERLLTDEMLMNGFPCTKYILQDIQTTVDIATFRKTYVNTMVSAGAEDSEIESALPLLSLKVKKNGPFSNYDFLACTNPVAEMSLINSIRMDENVPTYRTCDKFYKKFDKSRIACLVCPLSERYLNKNVQVERSVLAFALSSPDSFQYVVDNLVTHEHFKSVFDVMDYFSDAGKPSCYPLYAQTFLALQNPEIRNDYFHSKQQGEQSAELIAYHDQCLSASYIPRGLLSSALTARLESVLAEELETLPCPEKKEIDFLILRLLNPETVVEKGKQTNIFSADIDATENRAGAEATNKATEIAAHSNMGLDTLDQFYELPPVTSKKKNARKKVDQSSSIVQQSECGNVQADEFNANLNGAVEAVTLTDIVNPADESVVCTETVPKTDTLDAHSAPVEEMKNENPEADISSPDMFYERITDAEIVEALPGKSSAYYGVAAEAIVITEISEKKKRLGFHESGHDELVLLPVVAMEELTHFTLCLDSENIRLLSMFESYVLKDKRLSIELVKTDTENVYLLMYSPRMRAYFYTDMGSSIVKEILVPVLEHRSISKYCYFPYATLSALWKMGVYVKGVYSLFSVSALLYGDHRLEMDIVLEKMGATKAVGGITIKPTGEIESIPLKYMHAYANVYHRCRHEIIKRGFLAEYEDRNRFDKALSYSYYQNRFLENGTVLFSLPTANGYRFHTADARPQSGYSLLHYRFKNSLAISSKLIRDLLIRLDDAGRFRKWKLFIASVGVQSFTLCIQKKDYKAITTILNTTILAYLREQDLTGIEYSLEQTL